jgi:hypothetical protein
VFDGLSKLEALGVIDLKHIAVFDFLYLQRWRCFCLWVARAAAASGGEQAQAQRKR